MKKLKLIILLVVALFLVNLYYKAHNPSMPQITATQQQQLEEYSKEQIHKNQLAKLQSPTLIQSQLKKVSRITSLQGQYNYFSKLTEKDKFFKKFTLREITLDYKYTFNIGMDLQYIKITNIDNGVVHIDIPKNKIELQSITMNPESQIITGDKMFLVSQFSPTDIQVIVNQSQQLVIDKINSDGKTFDTAKVNMQSAVEKLILSLGYTQVIFEEV